MSSPPARTDDQQPVCSDSDNMSVLGRIFNWLCVSDINEENIFYMAQKLGLTLNNEDVWIKSNWKQYKQYVVFTVQTKQLFFIKRIWEVHFLREVLALHLGCYVLDPELFVFNYVTGMYRAGLWRWKERTPYIMTTFINGDDISKDFKRKPEDPLWYWLGRHFYLHLILSLYDVENRHFKVSHDNGTVKRLDLGLAFRNLDREYQGFEEYFGNQSYFQNPLFMKGLTFEKEIIPIHLTQTRSKFLRTMQGYKSLTADPVVDFDPQKFCQNLKKYWNDKVPELHLSEGW